MTEKKRRILLSAAAAGLVLVTVFANIKNIFTSCHVDAEYQIVLAYRLLQGDKMFSEMWEVHQTSAFFLAFFEWIFIKVTGSTTGIMVYANTVGFFCKAIIAFMIYRIFSRDADKKAAFAAWMIMMNTNVKDCMLPDFANLQVWSALLLMCCFLMYYRNQEKTGWLAAAAFCLCLEALAYPGCVLVWIPCVILIWIYSNKKKRDIGIFTGICVVSGTAYLLYFMRGNPQEFAENISYILSGDESHAVGLAGRLSLLGQDAVLLLKDLAYIAVVVLCAVIVVSLYRAACTKRGGSVKNKFFTHEICVCAPLDTNSHAQTQQSCVKSSAKMKIKMSGERFGHAVFTCFIGIYILAYLVYLPHEDAGEKYHFFVLYLFIECAALLCAKRLDNAGKRIFTIGQAIGSGGFFATLLMSDMGIFPSIPYLIPNLVVSMLPLLAVLGDEVSSMKRYMPVILFCGIMLFRNFIYLNGWMEVPSNFREDSIFGISGTVQNGPLKGIRNGDAVMAVDTAWEEWHDNVKPGDRVLILSYPTLAATAYLYEDVVISADSVICTPTYSERQLKYWEKNPDKYPNVVAAKWYDESLMVGGYNEVTKWLEEKTGGGCYQDDTYWRYYYIE